MLRQSYTTQSRLLDTVIAVALLGVAAVFLHFRSHHDTYTTADAVTVAMLLGAAFLIGWRDRVPTLVNGAARLLGRGKSDDHQP